MNERIKLLAEQANFTEQNILDMSPGFERFVELIVQKFDDILVLEHLDCVGNKDKKAMERVRRLRERVKIYFGVEE